eukprot:6209704-Pleurochrysis_carterae.AAC.2
MSTPLYNCGRACDTFDRYSKQRARENRQTSGNGRPLPGICPDAARLFSPRPRSSPTAASARTTASTRTSDPHPRRTRKREAAMNFFKKKLAVFNKKAEKAVDEVEKALAPEAAAAPQAAEPRADPAVPDQPAAPDQPDAPAQPIAQEPPVPPQQPDTPPIEAPADAPPMAGPPLIPAPELIEVPDAPAAPAAAEGEPASFASKSEEAIPGIVRMFSGCQD